jgi:hypothetical protein
MKNNDKNFDNIIYYVCSQNDNTVLLALKVEIRKDLNIVSWFDTIKYRNFEYSQISEENNNITIYRSDSKDNLIYTLTPLTLELYNQKVKKHMTIQKEYQDKETLYKDLNESISNCM